MTLLHTILYEVFALPPHTLQSYVPIVIRILGGKSPFLKQTPKAGFWDNYETSIVTPNGDKPTSANKGTLVIPVVGEIMKQKFCGYGTQDIANAIQEANTRNDVNSIVLKIDSPGGQVSGTDVAARIIQASKKPVVAFINGYGTSAAQWLASATRRTIAESPIDTVGSVGTMVSFVDMEDHLKRQGIELKTIYATDSVNKNKDYEELRRGNYDNFRRNRLDPVNKIFTDFIRAARPQATDDVFTGLSFNAADGITAGLIDEIGSFDTAIQTAQNLVNHKKTIYYV